jgi:hypothetical protein
MGTCWARIQRVERWLSHTGNKAKARQSVPPWSSPKVGGASYDASVPRTWLITMAILVACLIASIVIALVRLL